MLQRNGDIKVVGGKARISYGERELFVISLEIMGELLKLGVGAYPNTKNIIHKSVPY